MFQPDLLHHPAHRFFDRSLAMLNCDERLDPIRDDPGFRRIEAAMKFPR